MNRDEARKILGVVKENADVIGHFNRQKKLITERLKAAPNETLKAQYRGMLSQLEQAAAVLVGVNQKLSTRTRNDTTPLGIMELGPGQLLADRYLVKKQMVRDSVGVMLRVYDQRRDKDVVARVIYPELLSNEYNLDRFLTEARIASELYHPGIVYVTGWEIFDEYYFLVIEFIQGQTLRQLIKTRKKARKPFTTKEVSRFTESIADALNYAHITTEHGDIRPENIWVDEKGNYKIMGFGTVRLKRGYQITQTGAAQVNNYQAPEQLKYPDIVDDRVDQYALGVVMHELLTFEFPSANQKSVVIRHREIDKNIASVIKKMLSINPESRFGSMEEVISALTHMSPAWSLPKIRPKVLGAGLILIVVTVVTVVTMSGDLPGRLAGFWDDIRPLSADAKQQQFDDSIERVNEINRLIKELSQAKKKLRAKIRDEGRIISNLEDTLAHARSDEKKSETQQQLNQVRLDKALNENQQHLTEQVIFHDSRLIRSEGKVLIALALIENKDFHRASELLIPLQAGLKQDLQHFNATRTYLLAYETLIATQGSWLRYREPLNFLPPTDTEQRKQMINNTEILAQSGRLTQATKQAKQITRHYEKSFETDKQRIKDRARYKAQQGKIQKLEIEWRNYLKKHDLKITLKQRDSIDLVKSEEHAQLEQQDFSGAEIASQTLHQTLTEFYATSRAAVKTQLAKQKAEKARQAKAKREKALAAAEQAMAEKDYNQAVNQYQKALADKPEDTVTSKQLELAKSGTSSERLKKYAPGLVLVKIPAGNFMMGDLNRGGSSDEKPAHEVTIESFDLMKQEVTFAQYDIYVAQAGVKKPEDQGWGRDNRPVINVSWTDATNYARWLGEKTGYQFRLPSEAEWEYAARSGTGTKYPWGGSGSRENANYGKDICCDGLATGSDQWVNTAPVGSFPSNQFGIHDMHGNVWEWVQDCWNDSYNGAPNDGAAWMRGDCKRHPLRGGAWSGIADYLRSANRDGASSTKGNNSLGFRLVRER